MRLITLLMFCSFLVGSTHEPPVYKGKALKRDGLYYAPNSTEPRRRTLRNMMTVVR